MLTGGEKKCLALTLAFLSAGTGLRIWGRHQAVIGPLALASTLAAASSVVDTAAAPSGDTTAVDSTKLQVSSVVASPPASQPRTKQRAAGRSLARKASSGPVDINRAGAAELLGIPGIGDKTAEAIVSYRKTHGDFREVSELLNIKGIGEKKLEKMRSFLLISHR